MGKFTRLHHGQIILTAYTVVGSDARGTDTGENTHRGKRGAQGTRVISQRVLETICELVGATFFPLDESHVGGSRARPPLGFGEPDIQSSFTDVKRLADFEMSEWTS